MKNKHIVFIKYLYYLSYKKMHNRIINFTNLNNINASGDLEANYYHVHKHDNKYSLLLPIMIILSGFAMLLAMITFATKAPKIAPYVVVASIVQILFGMKIFIFINLKK